MARAKFSPWAPFRKRNFTILWSGQLVSTIGSALMSLAASLLVYRHTHSAFSVGLMLMASAAPSLLLGLIAGVFVDRFDRKRIMIAADLLRALIVFSIPFLVAQNLLWLYALVFLESCVTQFFDPAHASLLPEVATDEEMIAANWLMTISSFGATALGFAAAGLIAARWRIEWIFFTDAATFVFSAGCIARLALSPLRLEGATDVTTIRRNMRSGIAFLWSTPALRSLYLLFPLIFIVFGLWNALLLPFALQALGANEFEYGLQEAMTSVGFVVGCFMIARLSSHLLEGQWLTGSYLGMGLVNLIYAQMSSVPVATLLVTIAGFVNAPSLVARNLIIQRHTPREMRGRVNSAFAVTRNVAFLIGMAAAGLADVVGVRVVMFGSALLLLVPGAIALVVPGLGQPTAEWQRMLDLLRNAPLVQKVSKRRKSTPADLNALATQLPALAELSPQQRDLLAQSRVVEVPAGATIISRGETGDDVYFILSGRALAGIAENGAYRSLETMRAGDWFGEIAVLMATPRTANVVAEEATVLLQVPATTFRQLMENPKLSRLAHTKFLERMTRTSLGELPRVAAMDQQDLRALRGEK